MKKRIALLSDVHGNSTALSAVVEDLKKRDVDTCWFLGDLVMPGPGNNELFDLLAGINTDIYISKVIGMIVFLRLLKAILRLILVMSRMCILVF